MSMRLKKASSFKPKGLGKRGPSAPASSTRPSAERQSQTPVPTTETQSQTLAPTARPTEVITIPEEEEDIQNDAPPDSSTAEPTPRLIEIAEKTPAITEISTEDSLSLKRKGRDDEVDIELAQKRTRLEDAASPIADNSVKSSNLETAIQQTEDVQEPGQRNVQHTPPPQAVRAFEEPILSPHAQPTLSIRHSSPEASQDNPASIYPDPELSVTYLPSPILPSTEASHIADPHAAQVVPTATYNPDGTVSSTSLGVHNTGSNSDGAPTGSALHQAPVASAAPISKKKRGPVKNPRKRKSDAIVADGVSQNDNLGDMRASIENNIEKRRSSKKSGRKTGEKRKKKSKDNTDADENDTHEKKRRRRGVTPEGAENEEVDPTVMTMGELCKEMNIGRPFSRAEEIKKKDEARKEAKKESQRLRILRGVMGSEVGGASPTPEVTENDAPTLEAERVNEPQSVNHTTVRVNFGPDGRIVYDDQAFQLDLHQQARDNDGAQAAVEENDFSKLVTSASHGKRTSVLNWGVNDTKTFYQMLNSFGQDFDLLALSFGGSVQRRQVKLKAEWEQKHNPRKFQKAIRGLLTTDEFELAGDYQAKVEQSMGYKLEDLEDIEAELKEHAEKFAEQEASKIEAKAEDKRKKTEAIRNATRRAKGILEPQDEPEPEEEQEEQEEQEAEPEFDAQGRPKPVYVWTRPNKGQKPKRSKKKQNPHSSGNTGQAEVVGDVMPSIES